MILDNCAARGESAPRPVNTASALYRSHFNLNTITAAPLNENQEIGFLKTIHRIARKLNRTSRGLVLTGGGASSFCQIGAIEVLEEKGIYFDGVAGVSTGAIVAAYYAMGKDAKTMYQLVKNVLPNAKAILNKTLPLSASSANVNLIT